MGKVLKKVLIGIAVLIVLLGGLVFFMTQGMSEVMALTIHDVDFTQIADGEYDGKYCKRRWCYDVKVVVKGNRIEDIKILNQNFKAYQGLNTELTKRIIEQQRIAVDAVAGATVNSKAFLKAVENALTP